MIGKALRGGALLLFGAIVLLPVVSILATAFVVEGRLGLDHFEVVLSEARQWGLLLNTLLLGFGAGALALLLGFPFAFLVSRTDLPARPLFALLGFAPLLFPPLVHAIAWTDLVAVRGGAAAVAVFGLSTFPLVAVLAGRAFERIDARREEAAVLVGGEKTRIALSFRLALPAALVGALCAFVFAVSDFSVPDYLSSVGPKFNVYADEIFSRWQRLGSPGQAVASSFPPLLLAAAGIVAIARLRRRSAAVTVAGDFVPPARLRLRRAKGPALAFALAVASVGFLVPAASLARTAGSLGEVRRALVEAREDLLGTLLASTAAAAIATALVFVLAHLALRGRPALGRAIEAGALLPFAVPALALAVGLIRLWNRPGLPGAVYDGPAIVVLALVARYFPFPFFATGTALAHLDPSLEEAAAVSGARFGPRLARILFPLARPALASAFLLALLFGMRELDTIVLIPSGNRSAMFRIYNAIHFNRPAFVASLSLVLAFLVALPLALYRLLAGRRLEVPA